MKSSYVLGFLFIVIILVSGCGGKSEKLQKETAEQTDLPSVEKITDVESVEENFSIDDDEDDYGDII